ncbi:MAG TPA: O-antigen ligase domain-containing protein [Mesotoga infera]|uniref:O-antigen ligase domain-containing protein n=1 Tax=Mesotoga infera TaxID=1236046 RepID=A0A7C1CXT6_9BACT|nr:O-antigen ligase domain-containing protein [Mesotoga infera]
MRGDEQTAMVAYSAILAGNTIRISFRGVAFSCVLFMSALLNHSQKLFGFNLSLADLLLPISLVSLMILGTLRLRASYLSFFVSLSLVGLLSSAFLIPGITSYTMSLLSVLKGYIKIAVSFLFFSVGYSLNREWQGKVIQAYSRTAIGIGLIGVLLSISGSGFLREQFFYGSFRLRGLMSDLNYFSVIQASVLVYCIRNSKLRTFSKLVASSVLLLSIIASGSKTGLLTVGIYFAFLLFERIVASRQTVLLMTILCIVLILAVLLVPLVSSLFIVVLDSTTRVIPAFARVRFLFTDFSYAISEGGSSRDVAWGNAFYLIRLSPLFGTGFGTYSDVSSLVFGTRVIAHNTFLQMFAEWGIPLALTFFCYVFLVLVSVSRRMTNPDEVTLITRDIIIVFLVGSIGISLNNARMFWFFLGILTASAARPSREIQSRS